MSAAETWRPGQKYPRGYRPEPVRIPDWMKWRVGEAYEMLEIEKISRKGKRQPRVIAVGKGHLFVAKKTGRCRRIPLSDIKSVRYHESTLQETLFAVHMRTGERDCRWAIATPRVDFKFVLAINFLREHGTVATLLPVVKDPLYNYVKPLSLGTTTPTPSSFGGSTTPPASGAPQWREAVVPTATTPHTPMTVVVKSPYREYLKRCVVKGMTLVDGPAEVRAGIGLSITHVNEIPVATLFDERAVDSTERIQSCFTFRFDVHDTAVVAKPPAAVSLGLSCTSDSLQIASVAVGSPACRGGAMPFAGYAVASVNGVAVKSRKDLEQAIKTSGDEVKLRFKLSNTVTVRMLPGKDLGMRLNPQSIVTAVDKGSPAYAFGVPHFIGRKLLYINYKALPEGLHLLSRPLDRIDLVFADVVSPTLTPVPVPVPVPILTPTPVSILIPTPIPLPSVSIAALTPPSCLSTPFLTNLSGMGNGSMCLKSTPSLSCEL
eukprot:TRINITY_DN3553_c0_g1_i1.p1 TRINITY_DN3553_c0_g1~~TRINITY_DN3553_c0_g1_i1.p1  ORF type:complete len:489 (+),score=71.87 TRINITY_DN3553_c0_g1_i1:82-1548(+)